MTLSKLVLKSLQGHRVVDDHGAAKYSRSVLGVGQLGVQVEPGNSSHMKWMSSKQRLLTMFK